MTTPAYYGPAGPYDTESEAIAASGSREPWEFHKATNLARLTDAADRAGVRIGSYDRQILTWLAGFEPQTVEVIAAIIDRAATQEV